jgi:hypothetical protein
VRPPQNWKHVILTTLLFAGAETPIDATFYARIQADNTYYTEIPGQKMNKEMSFSSIYLTEEQYHQVKNPRFFDLPSLRLIFI